MPRNQPSTPETYDWESLPPAPDYPQDTSVRQRFQPWWWPWFRGAILVVILLMLSFLLGRLTALLPSSHTGSSRVVTRTLTTVQTFTDSKSIQTGDFVVHTTWYINWLCVPGTSSRGQYSFKIDVNNADTFNFVSTPIDQTCKSNNASGRIQELQTGHLYLYITSKGPWTIEIQAFQQTSS